jgi:uncharacterized membrane protein
MFDGILLPICIRASYIAYLYYSIILKYMEQTITNKKGKIWTFTVYSHTAKGTKVLCCVLAHDNGDMCRAPIDLGVQCPTKWPENRSKTHGKQEVQ